VAGLGPAAGVSVGRLSRLLNSLSSPDPAAAAAGLALLGAQHPADRILSDDQWGSIAPSSSPRSGGAVRRSGWGEVGGGSSCRRARPYRRDAGPAGRPTVWARNDYRRCQSLARELERRSD